MQSSQNEVSVTSGPSTTSFTPIIPSKTLNLREAPLKIDESIFYYLVHSYLLTVYQNETKDLNDKIGQIEKFGESLGKNINERVSVDLLEKLVRDKEKQDIRNLEYIKFICKEFWIYLFGKNIDRLQTNHKGTFFLTDSNFRFLGRVNSKKDDTKQYLAFGMRFIKALIRGALMAFSLDAEITMESSNDLEYAFVVRIKE
jgi:hypothetical protein